MALPYKHFTLHWNLIDKHAPTKTKYFSIHINSPRCNSTLRKLKQNVRKYNRNYTLNPTSYNLSQLVTARTIYRKALKYNTINYIKNILETNSKDYKKLYNATNKLLGRIKYNTQPDLPTDVLFNNFANYFINKIDKIYDKLIIKKTKLLQYVITGQTKITLKRLDAIITEVSD